MEALADRLIVALDFATVAEAKTLVDRLTGLSLTFKIGHELIFGGEGIAFARDLAAAGHGVFLDAKLLDIVNTVERSVAAISRLGARLLTVHGHDRKTLDAAVRGRGTSDLGLLAVTVMTHLDQRDLAEQGATMTSDGLVLQRARMAHAAGFTGVVASAREAAMIRAEVGSDFLIVTPGIRPSGSARGDQVRTMTPREAVAAGASHLVVGRPITRASDPLGAARAILGEIATAVAITTAT